MLGIGRAHFPPKILGVFFFFFFLHSASGTHLTHHHITNTMSTTFSSLSSSIIARQIARVSRPRPWIVPAPTTVRSSTFSSLTKSAIDRATARVSRPQTLSKVSSLSSKGSIVGGRQVPVVESGLRQATLSARASARASRDRPWLIQRSGSIATKVSKSNTKTAQWIKSQAVDLRQAPCRPPPMSDSSMSIPAAPINMPKRRPAATGPRQPVRYHSTSDNRTAAPSSRPQEVVTLASPDNSIAAIVREAFAFDIDKFRAEVQPLYDKIEAHRQYIRRLTRKPVTFDDKPTVIDNPRWIDKKEHVHPRPSRILGKLLAWRPLGDSNPYEHTLVWGSGLPSSFDHSDCENPGCHRRAKDLYMEDYEEWTAPAFTTISE